MTHPLHFGLKLSGQDTTIEALRTVTAARLLYAAAIPPMSRSRLLSAAQEVELAEGGPRHELIVGVDDAEQALSILHTSELVREARLSDEGIRVILAGDARTAAHINAMLVRAGVGVARLEPVRHSLEQRFLEITSRLDAAPGDAAGRQAHEEVRT